MLVEAIDDLPEAGCCLGKGENIKKLYAEQLSETRLHVLTSSTTDGGESVCFQPCEDDTP